MKPEEPNKNIPSFEKAKRRLKWKRLFGKKWFFPAVYVTAAALILSLAWWYQNYQLEEVTKTTKTKLGTSDTILQEEYVPDNPIGEEMVLPAGKNSQAVRTTGFYDEAGSQKSKEASLVKYANTYWPHTGVDFARKDGKTFDVVAVLDGKVTRIEDNPIVGYQVEIQHESGITTVYQCVDDVKVRKGQQVKQGDVIAKAGRNNFEKEAGVHLHFEVRNKNNQAVNPAQYLPGENE
ncbi:peptidoglycan DD-metalloendopeptidase family protein [Paenactinomyces guangxiensis]|uniref:M23 family metallopeptidase n=1 Tax=Paenactinomyces guangxiensis TaxID=1490290 RepID=A0A7W2AAK2_9BACL|nr:M23 family metallopeptidase [Paenactinomyces guangxiensis]MBA4495978.1 M23 family metallopeptidase [Paenactinomyces guangxiensis]MBH8593035.1 M23 family metallopeptidase [Paenactinomyces guangxiensis]